MKKKNYIKIDCIDLIQICSYYIDHNKNDQYEKDTVETARQIKDFVLFEEGYDMIIMSEPF